MSLSPLEGPGYDRGGYDRWQGSPEREAEISVNHNACEPIDRQDRRDLRARGRGHTALVHAWFPKRRASDD